MVLKGVVSKHLTREERGVRSRGHGNRAGDPVFFPHYRIQFCKSPKGLKGKTNEKKGKLRVSKLERIHSCACAYINTACPRLQPVTRIIVLSWISRGTRRHVVNQSTHSKCPRCVGSSTNHSSLVRRRAFPLITQRIFGW